MAVITIPAEELKSRVQSSKAITRSIAVKHSRHTQATDRVFRKAVRDIQKAAIAGDNDKIEDILARLQSEVMDILKDDLAFAVALALDSMEVEDASLLDDGTEESRDKTRTPFYLPAVAGYISILRREIAWFISSGLKLGDLALFLANPAYYLLGKGLYKKFKESVSAGGGRNYCVRKDLAKIGLYALSSAVYEAKARILRIQGRRVLGYVGFRNGDYPCPTCDYYAGLFMPIERMVYPLHVNCICGWYEVYADEVMGND